MSIVMYVCYWYVHGLIGVSESICVWWVFVCGGYMYGWVCVWLGIWVYVWSGIYLFGYMCMICYFI